MFGHHKHSHHRYGSHHAKKTELKGHSVGSSRVRAVHNVAKGPKVNVVVDGKVALSGVGYKAISDYLKVPSGPHTVSITTEDGTILASSNVNLNNGKDYTVVAHGDVSNLNSIALLSLQDDNSCPAKGKSHVRFIHAASGAPAVDIWANMNSIVFENVTYGSTGNPTYLPVDSGDLTLAVAPSGVREVVLGPLPLSLSPGKTYSIIASGLVGDAEAPLTALVSEDNSCSTIHL